jgi:hypothetical protein
MGHESAWSARTLKRGAGGRASTSIQTAISSAIDGCVQWVQWDQQLQADMQLCLACFPQGCANCLLCLNSTERLKKTRQSAHPSVTYRGPPACNY